MKKILFILFISLSINLYPQDQDSLTIEKNYFIEAYTFAATEFSDSLLIQYVNNYPDGKYLDKANDLIDVCFWQNVRFEDKKESYVEYIEKFPNGKAINLAQKILEEKYTIE